MVTKSFETYLAAEVARIGRREKVTADKAFLFWFGTHILELSEDDTREAMSVEGANDKGIDLFWVDDDEGRVIVAQGKYAADLNLRPKVSQVTKLESSLNWLANPKALARDGRPDLAQAAEDYLKAVNDGYGVALWFVYAGPKCANIDKHIAVYNQNPENLNKRRAFRHYYLALLQSSWEEMDGASRRIPQEVLTVVAGKTLPYDGPFGSAVVATVPGRDIVRLYEKHKDLLFDRNVRLFLGVRKGSVNAGIAETLKDHEASPNFWAYNNGITIVCDSFEVAGSGIEVKNFSIVNGCQTAVCLAQGPADEVSRTAVLVRVVAASPGIADDVIRFTNSQNPIRTWDIASQDRTQRRLKAEFGRLERPFIYLTRRGARPTAGLKQYREGRRLRQIRIDAIGQYAAAFRGWPVLAYAHKAFVFSRFHDDVFPPDVRVQEVLFEWTCGDVAREAVGRAIANKTDEEVRILKKGGTLFVTAVMSRVLSLRNGATYLNGATEEGVCSSTTRRKLRKYADYARDKYVQAVLDQAAIEGLELPTLIRSEEFYKKVIGRIERTYNTDAGARKWLEEALPAVGLSG
jgi:hypothetical protein